MRLFPLWSSPADPLGSVWRWASARVRHPQPSQPVIVRRTSLGGRRVSLVTRVPEDEREQEKRRADRRRRSEQLERGPLEAAALGAETRRKRRRVNVYLLIAGVVSLTFAALLWGLQPYDIIFKMKATLREGGETFGIWKKPPVELYLRVFLFNVTNKDEFLRGEEKLHVQEVGPYVYREVIEHTAIRFNGNGTITSIPRHPLILVPEMTNGSPSDIVHVPNIALLSMANVLEGSSYFTRTGFNLIVRQTGSEPIVQMTAEEFMFGYQDPLVGLGNTLLPSWIHFDKLGLIDRMYDYGDDTVTTFTGEIDLRTTGLMERYNGLTTMPQWESAPCNTVTYAHDGSKYPNFISRNETMTLYRKPFCRGVHQEYVEDAVVDGMRAYLFRFKEGALNYSREENKCYCKSTCLPSGLIDAESCYYGFPIALSYPHFYQGEESLVEAVQGIKPIEEEHASYFYVQPDVGLPLRMAARSQINMAVREMTGIRRVERFRNMVIPLLWTELRMDGLPAPLAARFYLLLHVLPVAQTIAIALLLVFGVLGTGFAVIRRPILMDTTMIAEEKEVDLDVDEDEDGNDAVDDDEEKYSSLLMEDTVKARKGSNQWPRRLSLGPSA
ncbi:scavenger receptor class B member 1-like [Ischnura elegans]|uniref:scavenger receptor class B member 1-like n=1 Tax=Ischnura elegans TaxID=197161 RepID=UPI001ED8727C|nr:scavenger receptor class B member 1-like [Ischnura elegans]